jgi:CheY-like chemotaxis protein
MLGASEIQVLIVEKELNSASDIRDWAFRNPVIPVFVGSGLEALIWLGKGNIPDLIMVDSGIEPMEGPDFIKTIKGIGYKFDF